MAVRHVADDLNEAPAAEPRAAESRAAESRAAGPQALKDGLERALVGAIDSIAEGVYAVDRRRQITYWSEGAERITGYAAGEIVGRHCYANILNHVDEAGEVLCHGRCPLVAAMGDGKERGASIYLRHREGHRIGVNVRALPFEGDNGRVAGAVEVFAETSSLAVARREAGELRLVAGVDPVTELPNRRTCEAKIAERLRRGRRGWTGGFLVLDLDGFKSINDTHGHRIGDEALRVVGRTLGRACRAEDYVARWGGDEFVVLVEGGDAGEPALDRGTVPCARRPVARHRRPGRARAGRVDRWCFGGRRGLSRDPLRPRRRSAVRGEASRPRSLRPCRRRGARGRSPGARRRVRLGATAGELTGPVRSRRPRAAHVEGAEDPGELPRSREHRRVAAGRRSWSSRPTKTSSVERGSGLRCKRAIGGLDHDDRVAVDDHVRDRPLVAVVDDRRLVA